METFLFALELPFHMGKTLYLKVYLVFPTFILNFISFVLFQILYYLITSITTVPFHLNIFVSSSGISNYDLISRDKVKLEQT